MEEQQQEQDRSFGALGSLALASVCATDFLWGALEVAREQGGWVRPERLGLRQRRALTSCLAWHPGLFRQMAHTTAGVCVRFCTDANEAALAVRLDAEPAATVATLRGMDEQQIEASGLADGVSVVVDGRPLGLIAPVNDVVRFSLADPRKDPGNGIIALPGLGERHEVSVWLPCLRGCTVRELWCDGTYVEAPTRRRRLLVFGDELAQGYCCGNPAHAWPAVLAERLGLELVNQSLAGQVFQPSAILDAQVEDVASIVVELGGNYAQERCDAATVAADVRGAFSEIARHWPQASVWAITPTWTNAEPGSVRAGSCFSQVTAIIERCAKRRGATVLDGKGLCAPGLGRLPSGAEVLDGQGNVSFAERMLALAEVGVLSPSELEAAALKVLKRAPAYAFPALEALRRGVGEAVFAQPSCVVVRIPNGDHMVFAPKPELAVAVCTHFDDARFLNVLGPDSVEQVKRELGFVRCEPYHLCVYKKKSPVPVDQEHASCICVLDESHLGAVMDRYSYPEFVERSRVREALRAKRFFGAFVEDELVGFVGEHPEGSIGMLEVAKEYERQGWGAALEATKINDSLARGETPWIEVYPQNKPSLRLQRKLGLTVGSAKKTCYLSREV